MFTLESLYALAQKAEHAFGAEVERFLGVLSGVDGTVAADVAEAETDVTAETATVEADAAAVVDAVAPAAEVATPAPVEQAPEATVAAV